MAGCKKAGRNKDSSSMKRYRQEARGFVNKLRKLKAHIKQQPQDQEASNALKRLESGGVTKYSFKQRAPGARGKVKSLLSSARSGAFTHDLKVDYTKSKDLYVLKSVGNVTNNVSPNFREVEEQFNEMQTTTVIYRLTNGKLYPIKSKTYTNPDVVSGKYARFVGNV
jgi:hypothetical protein